MTGVSFSSAAALLGSDSLLAGVIVGPFLQSWSARGRLALLFAVCDGAATLIGACLPHAPPTPPAILLYLVAVPLIALAASGSRRWLFVMPALLSLDNLAAGLPGASAPISALDSGLAAMVGLTLGWLLGRGVLMSVNAFKEGSWASR